MAPVNEIMPEHSTSSSWAHKYRGVRSFPYVPAKAQKTDQMTCQATVEDLDPPPALSSKPTDPISTALMNAYERDYTHLTVVSEDTRAPARLPQHPPSQRIAQERLSERLRLRRKSHAEVPEAGERVQSHYYGHALGGA